MWNKVYEKVKRYPAKVKVARLLVENGLRIADDGKIYCGPINIPDAKIAKAANADRRIVRNTVELIMKDEKLSNIFRAIKPGGPNLVEAAPHLGFDVIEIYADPNKPGIVAGASGIIAELGISIRQVIADDPELVPEPKLQIVVNGRVPGEVIEKMRRIRGVRSVTLK
ncbi:MAG: amino acid-binding protein [Thermoproteota archaeon]